MGILLIIASGILIALGQKWGIVLAIIGGLDILTDKFSKGLDILDTQLSKKFDEIRVEIEKIHSKTEIKLEENDLNAEEKMQYRVVWAIDEKGYSVKISELVTKFIGWGWKPLGGISAVKEPEGIRLYQALIRDPQDDHDFDFKPSTNSNNVETGDSYDDK